MQFSTTQLSNISAFAGLAVILLSKMNIYATQEQVMFALGAIWTLGSTAWNYYHRWSRGDISLGGLRK